MSRTPESESISKMDAIRQAVKVLGGDAQAADLQRFVHKEFGIEMTMDQIYQYRLRAKKELAGKSGISKKRAASGNGEITKTEAVRRALGKLGHHAKPLVIKDFVHKAFKLDIDLSTISNYKSTLLKKAAGQSVTRGPAPSSLPTGISTNDLRTMKEVLDRIGPDEAKQIIDILAT